MSRGCFGHNTPRKARSVPKGAKRERKARAPKAQKGSERRGPGVRAQSRQGASPSHFQSLVRIHGCEWERFCSAGLPTTAKGRTVGHFGVQIDRNAGRRRAIDAVIHAAGAVFVAKEANSRGDGDEKSHLGVTRPRNFARRGPPPVPPVLHHPHPPLARPFPPPPGRFRVRSGFPRRLTRLTQRAIG